MLQGICQPISVMFEKQNLLESDTSQSYHLPRPLTKANIIEECVKELVSLAYPLVYNACIEKDTTI